MNSEKNIEVVNDESFSLETLFHYVNENLYGLILLAVAFFIIYFVDYISRINALIFAIPTPIAGLPMPTNIPSIKPPNRNKFKKIKKQ
jgi:hypothetical protein